MAKATPDVPAAPQSTAVANYKAELQALAVATVEAEQPSGNWMSFRFGQLSIGGNRMKDDKVKTIVLMSIFENQWYKTKYDPENPASPSCFAFAEEEEDLKPHPDSAEPQAPTCAECPKNAWKSDPERGKGKWCKNVRRQAHLSANDLNIIPKADIVLAKLPVTSVENWKVYASQIGTTLNLPPLGVITEISCKPHDKKMLEVNFELVDKVPEEYIPALLARRKDIFPLIFAPYDKPQPTAPAQPPGGAEKYGR